MDFVHVCPTLDINVSKQSHVNVKWKQNSLLDFQNGSRSHSMKQKLSFDLKMVRKFNKVVLR